MLYFEQNSRDETIRRKADAVAEKRGIEIGEKRGIEIGEKRGIDIGEREKALSVASSMKEDDMPVDMISKYTGLSVEGIESL